MLFAKDYKTKHENLSSRSIYTLISLLNGLMISMTYSNAFEGMTDSKNNKNHIRLRKTEF